MSKSIIAIVGSTKIEVLSNLSQKEAAYRRRELVSSEENFDMLGNTIANYRFKTCK